MTTLFVHLGYPKTATTTFQQHVFPHHPEIDYLGKLIPSFRFTDPELFPALDQLMAVDSIGFRGVEAVRNLIQQCRARCTRPALLLSSESFLHVTATDQGVVADRVKAAFQPCKVIITIREQRSLLRSFYGLHGRFGQYIFVTKPESEPLKLPLTLDHWLELCFRAYHRNLPSLLCYRPIVDRYQALVGPENVGVFAFEELRRNPAAYTSRLAGFMDIDPQPMLELLHGRHEHAGLSRRELLWWRINQWFGRELTGDTIERRINSRLHRWLSHSPQLDDRIPPAWEERLAALYGPDNRALGDLIQQPLQELGYLT